MSSEFSLNIDCKVPDGESGIWRVKTIKEFKVLFRKDRVVMSSTGVDDITTLSFLNKTLNSLIVLTLHIPDSPSGTLQSIFRENSEDIYLEIIFAKILTGNSYKRQIYKALIIKER